MTTGVLLRVFMIIIGMMLLGATVSSLAKRKMTENVCLAWGVVSVVFILAGILLHPYGISQYISVTGLVLIMIIGVVVLQGAFVISAKISELARKNHELALQVSMLNYENRDILARVEKLEAEKREEKQIG
ncbi:MAG: DUF2304 domain-containing protein [Lachnospiraceae bacterium]|nr:DUF2304 domain-containing protein [Lachnospiraceae bacterium]